jgi:hypothetical protein
MAHQLPIEKEHRIYSSAEIEEKIQYELNQVGKSNPKINPLKSTPTEYSITNQLQCNLDLIENQKAEIKELLALLDKYQDIVKLFGLLRKYSLF